VNLAIAAASKVSQRTGSQSTCPDARSGCSVSGNRTVVVHPAGMAPVSGVAVRFYFCVTLLAQLLLHGLCKHSN
jgi:hypothetical protein